MSLYTRIKERREALGLSQDELAMRLNYKSRSTIAKIESGANDIPQSKIKAFADALNTTTSYLMGWDDIEESQEPSITDKEKELLNKYNELDEKGKHTVNTILDMEYNRCMEEKDYLKPIAAHGSMTENNIIDPRDLELAKKKKQVKR